ncbi:hypothetical protein DFP74_1563 [Nocardiopsis sp. Huas11]|uniref:hypothetical protein n=1 Tax=Nocardiopsis sp. Huas11 TaxID=2183912 RepID=UPI000F26E6FC|nr:hypothetical protein [Nocardiopsis sp. Huas11]RKS05946.1 hypothetical protein DFP74_1563 [Nocardiopsis sp. Huas11]
MSAIDSAHVQPALPAARSITTTIRPLPQNLAGRRTSMRPNTAFAAVDLNQC